MAQTDDIDELVSSVRDFVSHKEPQRTRSRILLDRLILTPELRVTDATVAKSPTNTAQMHQSAAPGADGLPPVKSFDKAGLEATIAELEAAVTAQFDDWEADEGESFAKAAWAASAFRPPQADSEQEAVPEVSFVHAAAQPDADAPQSLDDDDTDELSLEDEIVPALDVDESASVPLAVSDLDEAALRRLVAEIVHEELGGEMGERITRNVRKLVRREINRVLTSLEMGQG